jgi:hypothetical protein
MARRDADRFAGRERELEALERLLDADSPATIAFIHGPGGIGKSTLLRELERRARERGLAPLLIDARSLGADPGELERSLAEVEGAERPLLILDTYERAGALGSHLRTHVLPGLPSGARVVIAGRVPPEPDWRRGSWDAITTTIPLGPLDEVEAKALLSLRGLEEPEAADALLRWASGEPLALALGADAVTAPAGLDPARLGESPELAATLVRWIADDELSEANLDVLLVAAIARAVDAPLLADVLPGVGGDEAEQWLRELSFAETIAGRVTVHDRVRRGLRTEARKEDPEHERELRRKVADHLYSRAIGGEPRLVDEITALIDDPVVRWGFDGGDTHRVDRPRPGDEEAAAAALGASGTQWWASVKRFFVEAPDRIAVVRDDAGRLVGFCIAVTPESVPEWADEDPVLGGWLEHARAHVPDGNAVIWRGSFDLTAGRKGDPASPIVALLNTAANALSGLPNPRWFYAAVDPENEVALALSEAIGSRHLPELDVSDGKRTLQCHVLDHGPGGVISTVRGFVYRDLGLPVPRSSHPAIDSGAVREAMRSFHDVTTLADSSLAKGETRSQRAEHVRALLRDGLDSFGSSPHERLLRATLERGYLDPEASHERATQELHMSRSTYFRRLREATERLAAQLERG